MKAVPFLLFFLFLLNTCKESPTETIITSDNFTWQTFTFGGESGSCSLHDIAIINENDIWAVGEIYHDSANGKPDPNPYNAAHWDGNKWNLLKVPYYYQGQAFYSPIYSICAFGSNDIWFEAGIHWDGNQFQTLPLNIDFPSHVSKMWGTSSNDLYIIGYSGLIAHRGMNGYWQKLESGTDITLLDIYGARTSFGMYQILVVGSDNYPSRRTLLSINGNTVTPISTSPIPWDLYSIWFAPLQHYYLGGSGLYEKNSLSDNEWKNNSRDITNYAIACMRGNGLNDVFAVGSFGEVIHFNGKQWTSYIKQTGLSNGVYGGLAVKGNLVVATGANNRQAVILMGRR